MWLHPENRGGACQEPRQHLGSQSFGEEFHSLKADNVTEPTIQAQQTK
jgi:hypothetical protein